MFIDVHEYMKKSTLERQEHIDLSLNCIEIGGSDSTNYKGLLAHFLMTTIPSNTLLQGGSKIFLCHACNNHGCSNPRHLYWGTPSENNNDHVKSGRFRGFDLVGKYGEEKAKEMRRKAGSLGGLAGGGHNKGKTCIDLSMWKEELDAIDTTKYGWQSNLARKLGTTHTTVKRIVRNHFPHLLNKD
jgi:hypothetical protein